MSQSNSEAPEMEPGTVQYFFKGTAVRNDYTVLGQSVSKKRKERVNYTISSVDDDGDRCPTRWYGWKGTTYKIPCLTTDCGAGGPFVMHKLHLGPGTWLEFNYRPDSRVVVILSNEDVESLSDWKVDKKKHGGFPYKMINGEPIISYEDEYGDPLDPATLLDVMD